MRIGSREDRSDGVDDARRDIGHVRGHRPHKDSGDNRVYQPIGSSPKLSN